jgi:hypothetical protein
MADEPTSGVLLRGADGSHYFIPHADLSGFSVESPPGELAQRVEANAPRLDAFQVRRASGDAPAAEAWLVQDDDSDESY